MNKGFDSRLDRGWWVLRIGLGVGPFLAGLDKYFNVLTNWTGYISPLALKVLPFNGQTFMHIVGIIEMIVGLAISYQVDTRGSVCGFSMAGTYRHQPRLDGNVLRYRSAGRRDGLGGFCAGAHD